MNSSTCWSRCPQELALRLQTHERGPSQRRTCKLNRSFRALLALDPRAVRHTRHELPAQQALSPCSGGSISNFLGALRHRQRMQPIRAAAAEGEGFASSSPPSRGGTTSLSGVLKFLERQFLPLGLLTSLVVGFAFPGPGVAAAGLDIQKFATIGIFIIQGLNLRRGEALRAASSWGAALYGLAAVLFITPLMALPVQALPLGRPELAFGLAVFCCVPTALSSGVTLTTAVGGNTALALLLVIATNVGGIFSMPWVLAAMLGGGGNGVALSPLPLLRQLLHAILAPLLIGVAARSFIPGVARAVDANKRAVAIASACLLCLVPWLQVSKAAASGIPLSPGSLAAVAVAGAAIHLA
eukprot:CAMPEP_0206141098 /NCGR_PEP_ID=MMETSP1473-20131121/11778_1 /ASSEMBLY_ACC=CAM_ASM_001109 /TAXON_ID=1461547 /ORGANISM="Stichococcus sp, Strain RCC1054" /LENGTH=354 /DNA_ID=CAMNT_0053535511 /DNA_START=65 /DNA_END=1125 /DNA_ORIENTATION=+